MQDLSLPATASSPEVRASAAAGLLCLAGEAYPENAFAFFGPILEWTEAYLARDGSALTLDLRLTYLNTSSIKCLMDLLDVLEAAHRGGRAVAVNWHYDPENDRALDLAEEFREDLTLPFAILPDPAEV